MAKDHHSDLPKDLKFTVIVTSDTILSKKSRGEPFNDSSGDAAESLVKSAGFFLADRIYLPNDVQSIRTAVGSIISSGSADVVVVSGGTGVGRKDVTVEAVAPLLEKVLPGFGELFRRLSYDTVGTSSIASRSMAGIAKGVLVFLLPGSPDAVRLALEKIILPESPHLAKMFRG
jgi:molybdenum cofactor biosynthesis protein B